jgi:hypothetical protein
VTTGGGGPADIGPADGSMPDGDNRESGMPEA